MGFGISELLTKDHDKVGSMLSELVVELKNNTNAVPIFEDIANDLKTHIFLEETALFPNLSEEFRNRVVGLEMEHGAIWKLLDIIGHAIKTGDIDLATRRSESLIRVLKSHNLTEESDIYPIIDATFKGDVSELMKKNLPNGWICEVLRMN